MRRAVGLAVAYLVASVSGGLYWTAMTMYCVDSGLSYAEVALVTTAPGLFSILSRAFGIAADLHGARRKFALTGLAGCALSLGLAAAVEDARLLLIPNVLISLTWSLVNPVIFAEAMEDVGAGKGAGLVSAAGNAGWTLSVFASGLVYRELGFPLTALVSLAILLLSAAPMSSLSDQRGNVGLRRALSVGLESLFKLSRRERRALVSLLAFFIAYFGCSTIWAVKLYNALGRDPALYSAVLGLSGIVASASSVAAGALADRAGAWAALGVAATVYTFTNAMFAFLEDPTGLSLAYLAPVWSFSITALYALLGSRGSSASAAGTADAVISLASLLSPLAGLLADRVGVTRALLLMNLLPALLFFITHELKEA